METHPEGQATVGSVLHGFADVFYFLQGTGGAWGQCRWREAPGLLSAQHPRGSTASQEPGACGAFRAGQGGSAPQVCTFAKETTSTPSACQRGPSFMKIREKKSPGI